MISELDEARRQLRVVREELGRLIEENQDLRRRVEVLEANLEETEPTATITAEAQKAAAVD